MENYEKKYKEALETARKINSGEGFVPKGWSTLEVIFPELKESEDEKMWTLIKKYAHSNISDMALNADHITRKELEDWLEKQGDISPTKDELEALRIAAYEPTKNWSEKLQSLYEKLTHCKQIPNDKANWSEEDEDSVDIAIRIIQNGDDDCTGILDSGKALKWLQLLKQRFNGTK